ncbi:conserved virulence factor C family protein [Virgibacillus xinjiangensis]|uniref:Conserved virulence factor C family protein n=1 Tax=Virgibacillus xinjiangensis TaxID=393090 RepID=A0ABV7D0H4_9BACI
MKIISIEPTPSPHSMKINLDEALTDGKTLNFKRTDERENAPDYVKELFQIDGVKGIYQVIDFIALERHPKHDWEEILPRVRQVLGSAEDPEEMVIEGKTANDEAFGEVKVFVQMIRKIPMQVKLQDGDAEKRFSLPERFTNAAMEASMASENMLMERKWVEQSPRYGNIDEIGETIVEELSASYDEHRLANLLEEDDSAEAPRNETVTIEMLEHTDWKERYAALDRIIEPTLEHLPILTKALDDEKSSVRRLAAAFLGMIESEEVLPPLFKALHDKAVNVRRTAGDCISDLGYPSAIPEMAKALDDPSRIVRWRAAMFLYEAGDETAVPALREKLDDPEFEVRMQVKMALARIEGGRSAQGSIWHQMTQAVKKD